MGRNVVLILTDQERDTGPWDPDGMQAFRSALPHRKRLQRTARRYIQHRIVSTACVPSRTSLFTGVGPAVHGVTQTDGMAKQAHDPQLTWLPNNRVPTLGHRVRAAGMEAIYVGKWHLSLPSEGRLEPWGFSGWQGPEPHGPDPAQSGVSRDPTFVAQACQWLRQRADSAIQAPFLLVISLVNPHDIVFWPAWSLWAPGRLNLSGIPPMGKGPTDHEQRTHEPAILAQYRQGYYQAYAPAAITRMLYGATPDRYRRFYASLLRRTDEHLGHVLNTIDETGLSKNTDLIYTSDHGELLGAHGGLHQKFYNAFEETLRVPMFLRRANGTGAGTECEHLTTHLDLVPTILATMGIAHHTTPTGFSRTPPLGGSDLSTLHSDRPSYFVTFDHILGGESPEALVGRAIPKLGAALPMRYEPPTTPNRAVEAIIDRVTIDGVPTGPWKLIRYFNPDHPHASHDDEWSLYELGSDPCEQHDRVSDTACSTVRTTLHSRLTAARIASSWSSGTTGRDQPSSLSP